MSAPVPSVRRLDEAECRRLLECDDVGRLAIVQGSTPAIFPVNYVIDGDAIVFRTDPGTKLAHGPGALAAFEIDSLSREDRTGWSVVALGRLDHVTPEDERFARLSRLPVAPWAGGEKAYLMRLVPGVLSGREITAGPA